jgi:hypothetical protein
VLAEKRGEQDELQAIRAKLARALAMADVPIASSCMCRQTEPALSKCCG